MSGASQLVMIAVFWSVCSPSQSPQPSATGREKSGPQGQTGPKVGYRQRMPAQARDDERRTSRPMMQARTVAELYAVASALITAAHEQPFVLGLAEVRCWRDFTSKFEHLLDISTNA